MIFSVKRLFRCIILSFTLLFHSDLIPTTTVLGLRMTDHEAMIKSLLIKNDDNTDDEFPFPILESTADGDKRESPEDAIHNFDSNSAETQVNSCDQATSSDVNINSGCETAQTSDAKELVSDHPKEKKPTEHQDEGINSDCKIAQISIAKELVSNHLTKGKHTEHQWEGISSDCKTAQISDVKKLAPDNPKEKKIHRTSG